MITERHGRSRSPQPKSRVIGSYQPQNGKQRLPIWEEPMAEDFDFNTNLMRFVAAELHFLLGMTAAREMFGKSYFALGVSEKVAVDQMVVANVGSTFQQVTPALLAAQQAQQPVGFGIQAAEPKQEKP
jgi:hypothetical protein